MVMIFEDDIKLWLVDERRMLILDFNNNNGRVPIDRGLPPPDRSADATAEDLS